MQPTGNAPYERIKLMSCIKPADHSELIRMKMNIIASKKYITIINNHDHTTIFNLFDISSIYFHDHNQILTLYIIIYFFLITYPLNRVSNNKL